MYDCDIFGFEELGKTRDYNLTYVVRKSSRLLLLPEEIYVRHFYEIEGFRAQFRTLQKERNRLLDEIISKLQSSLSEQQLSRYRSVALMETTLAKPKVRQVTFVGAAQF